ncbi:head-tail connector protein [Solimicrobium silvestre]|uniref:Phage gp6-like head-tail connector protein n=1 Tax=Solimicrobium silvestre TaxID=2099400 RepID=A0A2S9GZF2_9BURK|nr:head-tail connector protein [Solimicrobium silvestre]PRC93083.1 Phage gp6-like head-tail connector protein [Solimicrobium silvestre]
MFVTLKLVKQNSSIDSSDTDEFLEFLINSAGQEAEEYLNRKLFINEVAMAQAVQDNKAGACPLVIVAPIQHAILIMIDEAYKNRGETVTGVSITSLPYGTRKRLDRYRIFAGL